MPGYIDTTKSFWLCWLPSFLVIFLIIQKFVSEKRKLWGVLAKRYSENWWGLFVVIYLRWYDFDGLWSHALRRLLNFFLILDTFQFWWRITSLVISVHVYWSILDSYPSCPISVQLYHSQSRCRCTVSRLYPEVFIALCLAQENWGKNVQVCCNIEVFVPVDVLFCIMSLVSVS